MKKRDFTSAFENDNSISTGISLDDAVHGLAPKLDTGRIVAKPISIFEIYPDPMQPRRAIPSSVRQGWNGDPAHVERVLAAWLNAVREESNGAFDLDDYLLAESSSEDESHRNERPPVGPMEVAFRGLVDLAATIYRDGLTNPITVASVENIFRLETGERRWLAYHLLHANFPDGKWEKIPARVVDAPNLWRQAAENNARDNLNAIGKTRQFALLLMDLLGSDKNNPVEFQPFDAFENEQEFYAQVADGNKYRVPRGKGQMLVSVIGLGNPDQLRDYRRLLTLPNEAWQIADDYNLAEYRLREILSAASDKKQLAMMVMEAAEERYHTASTEAVSANHRAVQSSKQLPTLPEFVNDFEKDLRKTQRKFAAMSDWEQTEVERFMQQRIEKLSEKEKDQYRNQIALYEMLIGALKRWL
jgi:hypothetical protein